MPLQIRPTSPADLPTLSRFLTLGFHVPPDTESLAPDVLLWKYLKEPPQGLGGASWLALADDGSLAAHIGCTRTAWRLAGSSEAVSTLHMLDWLSSPLHRGAGGLLMRRAYTQAQTQYGLGGSLAARSFGAPTGYQHRGPVAVFRRVLRPSWRLRQPGPDPLWRRALLAVRDVAQKQHDRPARLDPTLQLVPVPQFGTEIDDLLQRLDPPLMFTDRAPARLNAILHYPRGGPVAHLLKRSGTVEGYALSIVIPQGRVRVGKIIDLLLPHRDPSAWASAFHLIALDLKNRGADFVITCASTPWQTQSLPLSGFRHAYDLEFVIRDRQRLLPASDPAHLSFLEADYATLA